jgi:hypothetical protein
MEVFNSPHSVEGFTPLREITLLGLDLEFYEEQIPLVCCPATRFFEKKGSRSMDRELKLVEIFSYYMRILCDGYEGKLLELFANIITNNEEKGAGVVSNAGKKGIIELNNLACSINYDGSTSWDRTKGRAQRGSL